MYFTYRFSQVNVKIQYALAFLRKNEIKNENEEMIVAVNAIYAIA